MMIFTDHSDSDYSDFGSSDDDSVLTEDEEEDSDISDDEERDVDENEVKTLQEGGYSETVEDIAGRWRKGRVSTSTSGEWSRLYTGLQKWHSELSNERRLCVGLLTKPYRR